MSDAYGDNFLRQAYRLDAEISTQHGNLQTALANGDQYTADEASDRLLSLNRQKEDLKILANQYVTGQQHAAAVQQDNPYGLSAHEREIARNSFSARSAGGHELTDQEKEQIYASGKYAYHARRAAGYRDELDAQGRR
jgi:hypothetical protein